MPTDRPWVFLDTMVVAGIYAVSKQGNSSVIEESKKEWRRVVYLLSENGGLKNAKYSIPRPVFHELMSMNKQWQEYILTEESKGKEIFKSASESISDEILIKAAKYSYECKTNQFSNEGKLKSLDPLIAAYVSQKNGFIITENQRDYPESHFQIIAIEPVIIKGKDAILDRRIVFLLKHR